MIRIIVFRGLYWGPPIQRYYSCSLNSFWGQRIAWRCYEGGAPAAFEGFDLGMCFEAAPTNSCMCMAGGCFPKPNIQNPKLLNQISVQQEEASAKKAQPSGQTGLRD